jgi:hypothetical protein
MNTFKRAALVAATLAAGSTTMMATAVSAVATQIDEVRVGAGGFSFSGNGGTAGTLTWEELGTGATPTLDGRIHLDGVAGQCGRVLMTTREITGNTDEYLSEPFCAPSALHHSDPVVLVAGDDVQDVRVTVQSLDALGNWNDVASERYHYGPVVDTDAIQINRAKFDVGSGGLVAGNPSGAAELVWNSPEGWRIQPVLNGSLYMKNAGNEKTRLRVKCFDLAGDQVDDTEYSAEFFAPDDQEHEHAIVDLMACSDEAVVEVAVAIERFDVPTETWEQVGLTRATLD